LQNVPTTDHSAIMSNWTVRRKSQYSENPT